MLGECPPGANVRRVKISEDADLAFRAGVAGRAFPDGTAAQGAAVVTGPQGDIERLIEGTPRLPGQAEPHAAYRVGRALRIIGTFLDQASQPIDMGHEVRAKIAEAVLANAVRTPPIVWDDTDVVDYFLKSLQDEFKAEDLRILRERFLEYSRRTVVVTKRN